MSSAPSATHIAPPSGAPVTLHPPFIPTPPLDEPVEDPLTVPLPPVSEPPAPEVLVVLVVPPPVPPLLLLTELLVEPELALVELALVELALLELALVELALVELALVELEVELALELELEVEVVGTQLPLWQVPPVHGVPSGSVGFEHRPVVGLHVPALWHCDEAWHITGSDPTQKPPWHVSVCVQKLPSSQVAPSAFGGLEQRPLTMSQVPATWQPSAGWQTTGFPPMHTPAWQVSVCVHALPSLQDVPDWSVHVPCAPGTLHAWQSVVTPPPQAVLQQ
jgi:hypothetical protein